MTLKELVRAVLYYEMEDINVYAEEAGLFGGDARAGAELGALYSRVSEEKRGRLRELGRLLKEGTGFRQRPNPAARSLEASLRAHVARTDAAVRNYAALARVIIKPETKEALTGIILREQALLAELRALQAALKKDPA